MERRQAGREFERRVKSMLNEFFKMTAAGNDFILLDNRAGAVRADGIGDFVRRLCTRALSVGADGVILLENSQRADIRARFFNPDGGATFCGNGARCVARLAYLNGWAPSRMVVETDLGLHRAEISGSEVSFEMRDPSGFEEVTVEALARSWRGALLDTGVPHFVGIEERPLEGSFASAGRALRHHPRFAPAGVNVNFVHPLEQGQFSIRTYERGVEGETLACGTGCVAAALALAAVGMARSPVSLRTRAGSTIQVRFEGDPRRASGVRLEGEARLVYLGHLADEALCGFEPAR
jgi:diaminopimelate epimerase